MLIKDKTQLLVYKLFRHEQIPHDGLAICIAQNRRTCPFRMGHHPEHVAPAIADTGDIPQRPIWIGCGTDLSVFITIPENNLAICFQSVQCLFISIIATLTMRDGYFENIILLVLDKNVLAYEMLVAVTQ